MPDVVPLIRHGEPPLRIGHRGAPALAPENTIRGFRAAIAAGVDAVEFDVLDLADGTLVVAHSADLNEVSHGATEGTVDGLGLAQLRELAPELPTLAETLAFFSDEAGGVGLLVDLKVRGDAEKAIALIVEHGLAPRTVVSSPRPEDLRQARRTSDSLQVALTYPDDRHGLSRRPGMAPVVRTGLWGLRALAPFRVPALAAAAGAHAVSLHQRVVSRALVARLHARALAAIAWTADTPTDVVSLRHAGVDGIVTNDPRLLSMSYTGGSASSSTLAS